MRVKSNQAYLNTKPNFPVKEEKKTQPIVEEVEDKELVNPDDGEGEG